MTTPISILADPAQPNQRVYPFSALYRATLYTRDSFKAAQGVDAPNWDESLPAKYWFDSAVDVTITGEVYSYLVIDAFGNITTKKLTNKAAASVNIPGLIAFPPYSIAPTQASVGNPASGVNPDTLSTQDQANAIAAELAKLLGSAVSVVDISFSNPMFNISYNGETRRMWAVVFKGQPKLVGFLLQLINARGTGHPYTWNLDGNDPIPVITPDPPDGIHTGAPQPGAEIQPPVRALLSNEKLITVSLAKEIQRTDIADPTQPVTAAGYTDDDRAIAHQTYTNTVQILAALKSVGINPQS
jgi:hypothetical protein